MIGEGRRQLRDLRRMAPIYQAQQAQLAYDKVAEEARTLRQKQEVEAQVAKATDEILAGSLDPESDDFNAQATQFYVRNQLAFVDPRMREAMNFLQQQNNEYQQNRRALMQAQIDAEKAMRSRVLGATEKGLISLDEIPQDASEADVARIIGEATRRKEETAFERQQRESEQTQRRAAETWAARRGVPPNIIKAMPDSTSIYQVGSTYAGGGVGASGSRQNLMNYRDRINNLKSQIEFLNDQAAESTEEEQAKNFEQQARELSQEYLKASKEYNDLLAAGGGVGVMAPPAQLPSYGPYSTAYRQGFEAATGTPRAFTITPTAEVPTTAPAAIPTATVTPPAQAEQKPQVSLDAQIEDIPFSQRQKFIESQKQEQQKLKMVNESWEKARKDLEAKIKKVVPDANFEGTSINQLESFAKSILNRNTDIIQNPTYGTIPSTWETLEQAGIPIIDLLTNKTVFREPGEARRLMGFIGTQQVGYRELLENWAKSFLDKRGSRLPISESPTGATLTNQQAKDLDELKKLSGAK